VRVSLSHVYSITFAVSELSRREKMLELSFEKDRAGRVILK
jgi:hypothetical protein